MIRINLLGTTKPKKGKGRRRAFALPQLTTAGPSPLISGLAILVLAGASIYWYHARLEQKQEQLQTAIRDANRQITEMHRLKLVYLQRQKDFDAVKHRFDIIDQLRAQQAGPVNMLNTVTDTVNGTDGVWLLTLKDNGDNVSLDGVAVGPTYVANLMTKLRTTGFFKNIELKDTSQLDECLCDGGKKLETFSFTVIGDKATPADNKPVPPPAKAATQPKA